MHEMSIVQALIEAVDKELAAHPGAAVKTVRVRIGALRLVVPEMMQTCYAAATRDTPLAGTRLEIENVPAHARCRQCGSEFPVEEDWFQCPQCRSLDGELLSGRELDLMSIELSQPDKLS
jgi:hydrogenase nickel incorporation protein HypA/HybF